MGSVISKTPNEWGAYRFIDNIDETKFPEDDWQHNPDTSNVQAYPKRRWAYDGTPVLVALDQEVQSQIDSEMSRKQNEFGSVDLAWRGTCANRWLKTGAGLSIDTRTQPYLFRAAGHINALTFSQYRYGATAGGDIEIYFNNEKVHTFELRGVRYATRTSNLFDLEFDAGTMLSAYFRTVTGYRAAWVNLKLDYRYTLLINSEDGLLPNK